MNKAIIIAVVVAILFISGAFTGYSWAKRAGDRAIAKAEVEYREKLQKAKSKEVERVKLVYKTRIKLQTIKDPTGCLDTDWPDDFTARLRNHYSQSAN